MSSKWKQLGLVFSGVLIGVLVSLHLSVSAQRQEKAELPVDEMRAMANVFNAIKQVYVEPVDDSKLIKDAISGMVSGLDPHSSYLDADAFKDLEANTKGEFGGLGIEVGMEDGFVKVVSPIEGTPAFRAGIKSGDLIVRLDETPVKGLTLSEAVNRMRGKPNTTIKLTIVRKGENRPLEVTLTREVIKVRSVRSKYVEDGIGYVRVTQFQEATTADLADHITRLYKQGPVKSLVLDLRNDPGGLLDGAVGVSAAFLPAKSLVVYTDGRTEDSRRKFYAQPQHYARGSEDVLKSLPKAIKNVPMVVLVNGGSASASEIVAGALQDYKRATVMGTQTFGKGSVQTILPLSATTGLKLTTARYFTPNGRSIQATGITPDLLVEETAEGNSLRRVREADLDHHLSNPKLGAQSAPAVEKSEKQPPVRERKRNQDDSDLDAPIFEFGGKGDFQFEQALNFLRGKPVAQSKIAEGNTSAPQAK